MPKTIALGLSHPGTVRNRNESAFYIIDTLVPGKDDALAAHALHAGQAVHFYAVASGIGGHEVGDVAARATLAELQAASRRENNPARLDFFAFGRSFLQQADRAVRKLFHDRDDVFAGASLALLCLAGENAYVLSSGDSRVYRLRDGRLTLLTNDDPRTKEPPHQLTSFIGRLAEERPDQQPRLRQFPLETEDVFLLTTQGLTERLSDEALEARLAMPEIFTAKPDHLLREALAADTRENLSFVLLRVIDLVPAESELAPEPGQPKRRVRPPAKMDSTAVKAGLVLLASIAFGFFAGWVLLTMVF